MKEQGKSMKELYSFTINKKVKVEKTEEKGDEKIIKTVEEEVPVKVTLKEPSRKERSELERFHHAVFSKAVKDGILTRAMIRRAYDEMGGILAPEKAARKAELEKSVTLLRNEYQYLETISKTAKNKKAKSDNETKSEDVFKKFIDATQELDTFKSEEEEVYINSAENLARDKSIEWLVAYLTMVNFGESAAEAFSGNSLEEKNDSYEELLEEDEDFYSELFDKVVTLFTMWYLGRASTREDFDSIFEILYSDGVE